MDDKILLTFKETTLLNNTIDLYSFKREIKDQTFLLYLMVN